LAKLNNIKISLQQNESKILSFYLAPPLLSCILDEKFALNERINLLDVKVKKALKNVKTKSNELDDLIGKLFIIIINMKNYNTLICFLQRVEKTKKNGSKMRY